MTEEGPSTLRKRGVATLPVVLRSTQQRHRILMNRRYIGGAVAALRAMLHPGVNGGANMLAGPGVEVRRFNFAGSAGDGLVRLGGTKTAANSECLHPGYQFTPCIYSSGACIHAIIGELFCFLKLLLLP